jgi:hypothetical protein
MLLEVLVALAILGLGLTALVSGIPVTAAAVSEGTRLSTATFLAEARLEELRRVAWGAGASPIDLGLTFTDEAALPSPYADYARQVRVVDCGEAPGCGAVSSPLLRQVTVTVAYRPLTGSGLATSKSVSLTTLISRR